MFFAKLMFGMTKEVPYQSKQDFLCKNCNHISENPFVKVGILAFSKLIAFYAF